MLLHANASVHATNSGKSVRFRPFRVLSYVQTALHLAVARQHMDVVSTLALAKADVNLIDNAGVSLRILIFYF